MPKGVNALMEKAGVAPGEVDWFVPHSANLRIIESICTRSGLSLDNTIYSLEYYGNTSAGSIPLSLAEGVKDGRIQAGDQLLLYGFGGGLTHAGMLVKWPI